MTCCLKADWYVIPQQLSSDYTQNVLQNPGLGELLSRHTQQHCRRPSKIPVEQYDLVITLIRFVSARGFAHALRLLRRRALGQPLQGVHVRAARALRSVSRAYDGRPENACHRFPRRLAFPYLRDPDAVRAAFPAEKEEAVWADFRTLTTLGMAENYGMWVASGHAAAKRLEETLRPPGPI